MNERSVRLLDAAYVGCEQCSPFLMKREIKWNFFNLLEKNKTYNWNDHHWMQIIQPI